MTNQGKLFTSKGEIKEEQLRNYFLSLGYFVSRGIKYKSDDTDITDIDLFLYGRFSLLSRERINVDVKNKKQPQAFERILWTKGLMEILNFDSCIVATTDNRVVIRKYAELHNIILLDRNFLTKLKNKEDENRLIEEELSEGLKKIRSFQSYKGNTWLDIYEKSKSTLLYEMDFSGFNYNLGFLHYFLKKIVYDVQNMEKAIRLAYIILAHLFLILDFINKDIAFLEEDKRKKKISDGLKFGNLGKEGIDNTIKMALKIAGSKKMPHTVKALFDEIPTDILTNYFVKNENSKKLFMNAKEFEKLAFSRNIVIPKNLNSNLKGVFAVFLDYFNLSRTEYL